MGKRKKILISIFIALIALCVLLTTLHFCFAKKQVGAPVLWISDYNSFADITGSTDSQDDIFIAHKITIGAFHAESNSYSANYELTIGKDKEIQIKLEGSARKDEDNIYYVAEFFGQEIMNNVWCDFSVVVQKSVDDNSMNAGIVITQISGNKLGVALAIGEEVVSIDMLPEWAQPYYVPEDRGTTIASRKRSQRTRLSLH